MIDNPIPIPSRKHKLMVACRLSNNKEKRERYRDELLTKDLEEIREKAFEICSGFFTRKAPLLYGIFLKEMAELKDLIGKESFINKPDTGEEDGEFQTSDFPFPEKAEPSTDKE